MAANGEGRRLARPYGRRMTTVIPSSPALLHKPGSPAYEDACRLFNAMIERRPRYVARCTNPAEVALAIGFARELGLEIAVRGGGHSVAGLSLCDGGLVIDVRPMASVEIDVVRRTARVGGGATWAQLDRATQAHGLATTGGRVSTTGVAGLTLGGGSGWLERKHGLACDNLVGAELVTADGEVVRASAGENPDLLWALRGGGGNFGVVTELELQLHPVGPEVLAGLTLYSPEHAAGVMRLWRDLMRGAPEDLSLAYMALTAPDEPGIPAELVGKPAVAVAGMWAGDPADGEEVLRELRAYGPPALDAFEVMPYAEFQCSLDDPPGYRNYWTAEYVHDLPDAAIEALVARSAEKPEGPSQLFMVALGGAVPAADPASSPLVGRDAPFIVHPLSLWEDPADDERAIAWARGFREDMRPYATGASYLNFIGDEGSARVRAAFGEANHARLARVKAQWDPENVFRSNANVPPAEAP
jgi:FAD/FMN-containing dehydrogenase